eukprot:NODE_4227_length_842_cov_29.794451_g3901_i0.p1 GENE.NODE_4227_length_842_cov_29.794451_g3901_i0~~NODE_4227_length_842_cov_29.794451_g3901_i0.p1  ORF type:complete len:165 (+),score=23.78 NODE_4227_length_842_cov_29.794451_g3901_i0:249-743(+)
MKILFSSSPSSMNTLPPPYPFPAQAQSEKVWLGLEHSFLAITQYSLSLSVLYALPLFPPSLSSFSCTPFAILCWLVGWMILAVSFFAIALYLTYPFATVDSLSSNSCYCSTDTRDETCDINFTPQNLKSQQTINVQLPETNNQESTDNLSDQHHHHHHQQQQQQ